MKFITLLFLWNMFVFIQFLLFYYFPFVLSRSHLSSNFRPFHASVRVILLIMMKYLFSLTSHVLWRRFGFIPQWLYHVYTHNRTIGCGTC